MKARTAHQSMFFAKAQQHARRILKDPDALLRLAQKAERKASRLSSGMLNQLKTSVRLMRAYAKGDYKQVSWESMVVLVGAVLYVASPIDLIPDAIPVAGILDDATVLSFALRMVHEEVQEFLAWEKATGRTPPKASGQRPDPTLAGAGETEPPPPIGDRASKEPCRPMGSHGVRLGPSSTLTSWAETENRAARPTA